MEEEKEFCDVIVLISFPILSYADKGFVDTHCISESIRIA